MPIRTVAIPALTRGCPRAPASIKPTAPASTSPPSVSAGRPVLGSDDALAFLRTMRLEGTGTVRMGGTLVGGLAGSVTRSGSIRVSIAIGAFEGSIRFARGLAVGREVAGGFTASGFAATVGLAAGGDDISFGLEAKLGARAGGIGAGDFGIVVGPAHRAEDEVENVLFLRRGSLGLGLEFRRASRTFRVPRADESAAIRADEQDADFALLEDTVRIAVPQLFRMAKTRLEQFERFLPVEPEGSAEPDDGLVNHEGPAVPALRLVWRDGLLADGTKNPGLFRGHRHRIRVVPSRINSPFPLSSPIPGRTRA